MKYEVISMNYAFKKKKRKDAESNLFHWGTVLTYVSFTRMWVKIDLLLQSNFRYVLKHGFYTLP